MLGFLQRRSFCVGNPVVQAALNAIASAPANSVLLPPSESNSTATAPAVLRVSRTPRTVPKWHTQGHGEGMEGAWRGYGGAPMWVVQPTRSEEHTSELQSLRHLV